LPSDGARPSFFNPTARAKYDAWVEQHSEHPEAGDARERYMEIAEELGWKRDSKAPKGMGVSVSMMSGEQAAL
jgi:acyl-CoA-binding protein